MLFYRNMWKYRIEILLETPRFILTLEFVAPPFTRYIYLVSRKSKRGKTKVRKSRPQAANCRCCRSFGPKIRWLWHLGRYPWLWGFWTTSLPIRFASLYVIIRRTRRRLMPGTVEKGICLRLACQNCLNHSPDQRDLILSRIGNTCQCITWWLCFID